jgi:hypothetical protein
MPHRVQIQQLLIDLTVVIVLVVDIRHIADVVLPDEVLEDKGVDRCFVRPG